MQLPVYQGRLTARLPEGKWRILRVGHTAVAPADSVAGQEQGLRCDKLSSETVYKLWTDWFTYVYRKADAEPIRRMLKYVVCEEESPETDKRPALSKLTGNA